MYYFAVTSSIIIETGEKPTIKKAKRKPTQRGLYIWASSLQSEADNPQVTISEEAKVVIRKGVKNPEEKEGRS